MYRQAQGVMLRQAQHDNTDRLTLVMLSLSKHGKPAASKNKTAHGFNHGLFCFCSFAANKVVELEGIEPSSSDATTGAFYMFIPVRCRAGAGTEKTLPLPYPAR